MRKLAINWSGGPDSTVCLKHFLETTNVPIIALHTIGSESSPDGVRNEEKHIDNLYPYMQECYRPFELYKVRHERAEKTHGSQFTLYPCLFFLNGEGGTLYIGKCRNDKAQYKEQWICDVLNIQRQALKALNVDVVLFNLEKPKRQIRKELGETLWDMTVSCIYPFPDGTICGNCAKCNERNRTTLMRRY